MRTFKTSRQFDLELLESRNLLSVSALNGVVTIQAPQVSGNVVQIDRVSGGAIQVTLDGATQTFAAGTVNTITYYSGQLGGDTFTNNTDLTEVINAYGGNNTVNSGTGVDIEFFDTDGNTINEHGTFSVIFTRGGQNTINGTPTFVF